MKINLTYLLGAALIGLSSCEPIDKDDRFLPLDQIEAKRGVLVEDFTGQKCVNCPKAHQVINQLHHAYGNKIVAVAIHGGIFAVPETKKGLGTEIGNEYAQKWEIEAFPSAVINRKAISGVVDQWTTEVLNVIWQEPQMDIHVSAKLNGDNKITIKTDLGSDKEVKGKLQLWLLEDGIIAPQSQEDGSVEKKYVHNHVFRRAINGTWGEDVSIAKNSNLEKEHIYEINPGKDNFNNDNLSVVAFVYNDELGVLQAVQEKVEK